MTNIKEINLSTGKWLMVEVPKESWNYELSNEKSMIRYWVNSLDETFTGYENLPVGHTYTLIGKASELTEDQWKGIVESDQRDNYKGYKVYRPKDDGVFTTATESGINLLSAYEIYTPEKTIIIRKH